MFASIFNPNPGGMENVIDSLFEVEIIHGVNISTLRVNSRGVVGFLRVNRPIGRQRIAPSDPSNGPKSSRLLTIGVSPVRKGVGLRVCFR